MAETSSDRVKVTREDLKSKIVQESESSWALLLFPLVFEELLGGNEAKRLMDFVFQSLTSFPSWEIPLEVDEQDGEEEEEDEE